MCAKQGNGCGPFWWPKIWKDQYFNDACEQHDFDYDNQIGRAMADRLFFEYMLDIVHAKRGGWPRKAQAYIFYWSVRLGGGLSYYVAGRKKMAWVTDNLVLDDVSGTSPAINETISKDFHSEDPRYLVVEVLGGLTNFKLQGRVGDGSWRDIKTQAAGTRLVFVGPDEGTADLLDDQLRVVALASANVDQVFVSRTK